jgi:hypothetical protein
MTPMAEMKKPAAAKMTGLVGVAAAAVKCLT